MRVEFDWKNFEIEKPIDGSKVIFKHDNELILGVYKGVISNDYPRTGMYADERNLPVYGFIGTIINTKSLSKSKQVLFPIHTPLCYINNHNPYDFEWDYYIENWLDYKN